jgi:acetyl esterase/lipase
MANCIYILIRRRAFAVGLLAFLTFSPLAGAGDAAAFQRQEDIIYGRKDGVALTMDVFQPEQTNGFGIVFAVSGGWFSSKAAISPAFYKSFLDRGYTVFAVVHGSQPKFQIPEIIRDMNRAVRFIRHNAGRFGIDPNHIGMSGMSAGGHLSLIIGTQGGMGDPKAKDPVDRDSSAVQCVACFFPPTDFLNYGAPHTNVLGEGTLATYRPAFGNIPSDPEARQKYGESISPIYWITTNLPPTLIIQGDADTLVPPQQAISFRDRADALGNNVKVILKSGKEHGWKDFEPDTESCSDWFDRYLRGKKTEQAVH